MATINFTNGTIIPASWLNDVDAEVYVTVPTLVTKTLVTVNAVDDAAAAAAGVTVGQFYRNGSILMVRVA